MSEGAMSTGSLKTADLLQTAGRQETRARTWDVGSAEGWSPQNFARQQIRGLVRQIFFSSPARSVGQVVFASVEPETDVRNICRQVGDALALESAGSVAVVGEYPQVLRDTDTCQAAIDGSMPLRQIATRLRGNVWLVPAAANGGVSTASLHKHLGTIRREFDYSIVAAPPAAESGEAAAMAQFADGIILVLSARHTRRVTALRMKQILEAGQAHLLGTVLSDRVFPIPEPIYRRL